jgi:hypothetical protein
MMTQNDLHEKRLVLNAFVRGFVKVVNTLFNDDMQAKDITQEPEFKKLFSHFNVKGNYNDFN